jgi:cyclase
MLAVRIIPVLLIRNKGLVKTIKFDKSKYIGDPINAVKIFNDKEVDEIVILDIDASKKNSKPDFDLIASIASECFMPLAYGGGVQTLEDMSRLFDIGVEKVILNTSTLVNLNLVRAASDYFGAQSVVVCIDFKKNIFGNYSLFSHLKGKLNDQNIFEFIQNIEKAGAGELILQSVDRDGTFSGYDLNFIKLVSQKTSIPIVACGGAGKLEDLNLAFQAGASGVAAGSLFVYHGPHRAVLINYPSITQLKTIFSQ